jgi:hypothetical protein
MTKESGSIQNAGDGQLDGFMTTLQAIFAESADYTKKSDQRDSIDWEGYALPA